MRLAFVLLLASACSAKHGDPVGPGSAGSAGSATAGSAQEAGAAGPVVVTDADGARAHAGQRVAVQGTARDAKLGGVILNGGFVVYCLGVESWPSDVHGKAVTGRGTLEETTEFQAADDESAGTQGAVWVLRACEYEPAP